MHGIAHNYVKTIYFGRSIYHLIITVKTYSRLELASSSLCTIFECICERFHLKCSSSRLFALLTKNEADSASPKTELALCTSSAVLNASLFSFQHKKKRTIATGIMSADAATPNPHLFLFSISLHSRFRGKQTIYLINHLIYILKRIPW